MGNEEVHNNLVLQTKTKETSLFSPVFHYHKYSTLCFQSKYCDSVDFCVSPLEPVPSSVTWTTVLASLPLASF